MTSTTPRCRRPLSVRQLLCLGFTAFTLVTGDLAFGLTSLLHEAAVKEAGKAEDAATISVIWLEDPAAKTLIDKFENDRRHLKEEGRQIEMRRQSLEVLEAKSQLLRKTIDDIETRISTILDNLVETEKANQKGLLQLVSQIEAEAGH